MSQAADAPPKSLDPRGNAADQHVLAQVEKWMAMIREISHQGQAGTKLSG